MFRRGIEFPTPMLLKKLDWLKKGVKGKPQKEVELQRVKEANGRSQWRLEVGMREARYS
jgi:hypothetical protein